MSKGPFRSALPGLGNAREQGPAPNRVEGLVGIVGIQGIGGRFPIGDVEDSADDIRPGDAEGILPAHRQVVADPPRVAAGAEVVRTIGEPVGTPLHRHVTPARPQYEVGSVSRMVVRLLQTRGARVELQQVRPPGIQLEVGPSPSSSPPAPGDEFQRHRFCRYPRPA